MSTLNFAKILQILKENASQDKYKKLRWPNAVKQIRINARTKHSTMHHKRGIFRASFSI